jgi:hypothetical protein
MLNAAGASLARREMRLHKILYFVKLGRCGRSRFSYCFSCDVLQWRTPRARAVASAIVIAAAACAACSDQNEKLRAHQEKIQSLSASTGSIADAWLAGSTSGTYAVTALEQTFLLLEKERAALASEPESLVDSRGAELSQSAERLSRMIATMIRDVRRSDSAAVRQHLAHVSAGSHQPSVPTAASVSQ